MLEVGNITVDNIIYPRRVVDGYGPQWGELDGVKGLFINMNMTMTMSMSMNMTMLDVIYVNNEEEGDLFHHHGQIPNYTLDGVPYIDSPLIGVNQSKVSVYITVHQYYYHY